MDVELKAPGYPVQKPSKATKSGRRRHQSDDSELLVGIAAVLALKAEHSSDDGEDSCGDDSSEESGEDGNAEEVDASNDEEFKEKPQPDEEADRTLEEQTSTSSSKVNIHELYFTIALGSGLIHLYVAK